MQIVGTEWHRRMCVQAVANHLQGCGVICESGWYSSSLAVSSENGQCEITVRTNEIYKQTGLSCWSRTTGHVRFARLRILLSRCGLDERHS